MAKPNIFQRLFSGGVEKISDSIGNAFDRNFTNDHEKLQAKQELTATVLEELNTITELQSQILVTEMKGNWLQRSWRPMVMLAFAAIVVYSKFIAPAFGLPNSELETDFWNLLELGIGGYVIGRSAEKITDRVTQNVDLSFLKKKDRDQKIEG